MFKRFRVRPGASPVGAQACCLAGLVLLLLWTPAAQAQSCWLRDAVSPAPSTAYLLCEQGRIWATVDGGATWSARNTGAPERLRAITFLDAQRGFAIGNRGVLLATADGGRTWQPRPSGGTQHLLDITFAGDSGWIAGYSGLILHSTDAGRTWTKQTTGTTQALENIFFLDQDHGWTVGWAGTILRTTDGGKTWTQSKSDAARWSMTGVYFRDAKNGWAVGFAGQILRSRDGGLTWEPQTSPVKGTLNAVAFDSSNRGWITYDDGFLLSEDGGENWKPVKTAGRFFLGKLIAVDNSLWTIGQSVALKQTGTEWKKIDSLVPNRTAPDSTSKNPPAAPPTQ